MISPELFGRTLEPYELEEFSAGRIYPDQPYPTLSYSLVIMPITSKGLDLGGLKSLFTVERLWDETNGTYVEEKRYVRIGEVFVEKKYRGKGLAKQMLDLLEERAREFGASYIEGRIIPSDRASQPWLVDMYRKKGYAVIEKEGDRKILKQL